MLSMLNRMCWNSRGWRLPTNTSGDGGYPSKMGFGHEEWNFQVEDAVDGFVYGYLYYEPSIEVTKLSGGHFRIVFWSIHPETRQWLIVGAYANTTLAQKEAYSRVDSVFVDKKIYERRAQELRSAIPNMVWKDALAQVTDSIRQHYLRFKCPVEDVHHLAEYIPVREVVKVPIGAYFSTPTILYDTALPAIPRRPSVAPKGKQIRSNVAALAEDAYYRESSKNLRLIVKRHNKLSNQFATWLRRSGYLEVVQEQNCVDIVFEKDNKIHRAELKVCYGTGSTKAIREALGQLLEYNYYPGRTLASQWVIVLDEKATDDDVNILIV